VVVAERPFDYKVTVTGLEHDSALHVTCTQYTAPISKHIPLEDWGKKWYNGTRAQNGTCSNGTWIGFEVFGGFGLKLHGLNCVSYEQIELLKEMKHLMLWTEQKLQEAEAMNFKWIDASALLRKNSLVHALGWAHTCLDKAVNQEDVASKWDLQKVIDALNSNVIIARGEPPSQAACENIQNHFRNQQLNVTPSTDDDLQAIPLVDFKCSYAVNKKALSWDWLTRTTSYWFRDGCMCESRWTKLCPFQIEHTPSYKFFGFDSAEEKEVSSSTGAGVNGLCWYWSNPTHPEWGFLRDAKR